MTTNVKDTVSNLDHLLNTIVESIDELRDRIATLEGRPRPSREDLIGELQEEFWNLNDDREFAGSVIFDLAVKHGWINKEDFSG